MTEGTPAEDFAEHADVVARWRPFRDDAERDVATTRLGDASALLRIRIPDLAARAAADADVARTAKSVVVEVVRRFLRNPEGAKQLQQTIGPRSFGLTFDGDKPTGIFFTEEELDSLQPSATAGQGHAIGTAFATFRPGWGPHERPCAWTWPTS